MKRANPPKHESSSSDLDLALLVLALAGLVLNLILLWRHGFGAAALAGCGGGGCDKVLSSRWSVVFDLPVTGGGAAAYVGLMVSIMPRFRLLNRMFLGMIAGAALWFVLVQGLLVGALCQWCMAAHAVALLSLAVGSFRIRQDAGGGSWAGSVAQWTLAGFLAIGLAQVYGPVPERHRLSTVPVSIAAGELDAAPRLGAADAGKRVVEFFDYQCAACSTMAGYLETLIGRYPGQVAVILRPVPLEAACNPGLAPSVEHAGSCAITRTALAVWRANPDGFPEFHRDLLRVGPSAVSSRMARELAIGLLGSERYAEAIKDPWIDQQIRANTAEWRRLSRETPKLPKLLLEGRRIVHGLPSDQEEFLEVMTRELDLPAPEN